MLYRSYVPRTPLAAFVECFWFCSDAPSHPRERILPSGTIELVFNLRENEIRVYDPTSDDSCRRYSGAVVSGPYSGFFVIDPLQHASIIGVHFKPGGAVPFVGAPARELADTHVDLENLWGPSAVRLRERLCAAGPLERHSLLEESLTARLRQPTKRHSAVSIALDAFQQFADDTRIRDVACRVGLSQRRFIQVFADEVGLTPKLYCRVRRFQQALELVSHIEVPNWAKIAAHCGYFDQSHLIRDFQAFSGLSPRNCLLCRNKELLPNHVAPVM